MIPQSAANFDFSGINLQPCPFCGEYNVEVHITKYMIKADKYVVVCLSCGAKGGEARQIQNAIKNWQKRV